jgi:SAM-dependent methyltransferase
MDGKCKSFYERSYRAAGFAAQRRYPNEELMRFMGRTFFSLPSDKRNNVRILETGCGSGANLWAIAREGFDTYGIDLSTEGISLCHEMLQAWECSAKLQVGDMTTLPYESAYFDAVVDVFASYCLPETEFRRYLDEVGRVLKSGGVFFSYALSKESDVFKEAAVSEKIDQTTLDGIRRPTAPYYGNLYPVRFVTPEEYAALLHDAGERCFTVTYDEIVGWTYRNREEYFEYVVIQAKKI